MIVITHFKIKKKTHNSTILSDSLKLHLDPTFDEWSKMNCVKEDRGGITVYCWIAVFDLFNEITQP